LSRDEAVIHIAKQGKAGTGRLRFAGTGGQQKAVIYAGPGELKVSSNPNSILRAPVLGSCAALFIYSNDRRIAGLAHVMLPSFGHGGSPRNADVAVRELAKRLLAMGARKGSLRAALVARSQDASLGRRIIGSIKEALDTEKIGLQAELYARSKLSASADMDVGSSAIRCLSRESPPATFLTQDKYFDEILRKVRRRTGFGLGEYRSSTLQRRMGLRMARTGAEGYKEYSEFLDRNPGEFGELLRTLAINVTGFFRDPEVFDAIRKSVLPSLASRKRRIRAWSAGCATGEEAYSLAMLLEGFRRSGRISGYSITATDLSGSVLEAAKKGAYRPSQLKEIPPYARRIIGSAGNPLRMPESLKRRIRFAKHDLTSGRFPNGFDLVLCRNVFIFYSPEAQRKMLAGLARSMAPGGYLVLGTAEKQVKPGSGLEKSGGLNIYMKKLEEKKKGT